MNALSKTDSSERQYVEHFLEFQPKTGEEIQTFAPTRYELIQLVKYWKKEILQVEWKMFLTYEADAYETGLRFLARIRIDQIREVIGQDEVDKAISEAEEEFSRTLKPTYWETFLQGDEAACDRLRDAVWAEGGAGFQTKANSLSFEYFTTNYGLDKNEGSN